uniref:hypothetical protein n=1 Tax=Bartonella sp. CL32QHWL-2 TaxID=3243525 RepID=UPI0035CEC285
LPWKIFLPARIPTNEHTHKIKTIVATTSTPKLSIKRATRKIKYRICTYKSLKEKHIKNDV